MGGEDSGALSSEQRNIALGSDSRTTPSTSITSSFTFLVRSDAPFLAFPSERASFFPLSSVDDIDDAEKAGDIGKLETVLPQVVEI